MKDREWVGVVLSTLGDHIRRLEDENAQHRAFRERDREEIRKITEQFSVGVDGVEQLALDNTALVEQCRCWMSWAKQARKFREDATVAMTQVLMEKRDALEYLQFFMTRVRDGAYDVITMPGDSHRDGAQPPRPGNPEPTYASPFIGVGTGGPGLPADATAVENRAGQPVQDPGGTDPEADRRDQG